VERYGRRLAKSRARGAGHLLYEVARVGGLGWLIALPIVAGALFGHWLDERLGTGIAWTLGLLTTGVALGGYGLWSTLSLHGIEPEQEPEDAAGDDEPPREAP